ncbi:restriction endonuclease [Ectobacillus funiculus]|uniref:restriction endonuclease n=1 Tax=Ectobacillus funiculus TaxID=137993 RepID=UPI0013ECAACF|nr:restriction endonuclease [Ectobacillus funiculus]
MKRLKGEGVLSQGWGGGENGGLSIEQDNYQLLCKKYYELTSTRIPTNLMKMKLFRDGDILVTPHFPENGTVSIHIVDGNYPSCYVYNPEDDTHLNHVIKVKKSYGLNGNISIYNHRLASWYGKLQWLRLPILPIEQFESKFKEIIYELEENAAATFNLSYIEEYLHEQYSLILHRLKGSLTNISPSISHISFEAVCEHLLVKEGYRIQNKNVFDGKGGDVDLLCTRERTEISPFETGQTILFVQIKKHSGTTDAHAVRQLIQMMEKEPSADGCVMSLADDFTEEACKLADEKGILLMNGGTICRLLLKIMTA